MLIHNNSTNLSLRKISKNIDDMMSQYSCINNRCNFNNIAKLLSYKMSDFEYRYISGNKPKFTISADSEYYESTEYIDEDDSFSDIMFWYK